MLPRMEPVTGDRGVIAGGTGDTAGMKNWATEHQLIELRRQSATDEEFWRTRHTLRNLTAEVAIPEHVHRQLTPWDRATARAAAVGLTVDTAVVTGLAAARLWGIKVLSSDPTVELTLPERRRGPSKRYWPEQVIYRNAILPTRDIHHEHGLRVTTVSRTLRDITSYHGVLEGLVAIDSARMKWPTINRDSLRRELLHGPKYHRMRQVAQAIALSVPDAASPLETTGRYILATADLPGIRSLQTQAPVSLGPGRGNYYLDLLINGWLAVELDGRHKLDGSTFGPTDAMLRAERNREVAIQNQGIRVLRAGWDHLQPGPDGHIPLVQSVYSALQAHDRRAAS